MNCFSIVIYLPSLPAGSLLAGRLSPYRQKNIFENASIKTLKYEKGNNVDSCCYDFSCNNGAIL